MNPEPSSPATKEREASVVAIRSWLVTAAIAALFCLAVCTTLIVQFTTRTARDPWKSPQLLQLKAQLAAAPKDKEIKTQIRVLDLKFRQSFFRRLKVDNAAGWLLLGGAAVFLFAMQRAAVLRKTSPLPQPNPNAEAQALRQAAQARWAVAAVGVIVLATLAMAASIERTALPSGVADIPKLLGKNSDAAAPTQSDADPGGGIHPAQPQPDTENPNQPHPNLTRPTQNHLPSLAEFQKYWPRFRGPDGSGFSPKATAPIAWDESAKSGVLWKAPIALPGFNSPIVWGNCIFISGGTAKKREVYCYNATDGKLVWTRAIENVPGSPPTAPDIPEMTGYAAPTMATDGRRVYVIFANGDLAAVTFEGNLAWSKHLGVPKNQYGHATSLAVWQGKLIVQLDQGDSDPANSRLTLFDGPTGNVVWEKARQVPGSWASPIVVEAAGKTQIITAGLPWLTAYSFADGAQLWKAALLEGEVTPSPILAGGLVCIANPSNKLFAVRPDGSGDVTKTHIAWTSDESVPDVTSPTSNGEVIFYVSSGGMGTCLDVKTGQKLWQHDFGTEVQASPGIAGDRVYVVATNGHAWVFQAGREYKELGKGALNDKLYASPAFAGGRLYLRGNASLYCIGEK